MRYSIRRISPGSALRVGCTLGWIIAVGPALLIAFVAIKALQKVNEALVNVETINIEVFGQSIASLDILSMLNMSDTAQTVSQLSASIGVTFVGLLLLLTAVGAVMVMLVMLIFSMGYNLLAMIGGGLEVDLEPRDQRR